jgi:hypothetical protein
LSAAVSLLHQTIKTKSNMKTTILIIAAALTFQVSNIFGANDLNNNSPAKDITTSAVLALSPVTPAEAGFSDFSTEPVFPASNLAPVTPALADFDDNAPETASAGIDLAPETPSSADFDETPAGQSSIVSLAPEAPLAADFE